VPRRVEAEGFDAAAAVAAGAVGAGVVAAIAAVVVAAVTVAAVADVFVAALVAAFVVAAFWRRSRRRCFVVRAMGEPERVALYGGTFDPVHDGHLAVARGLSGLFGFGQVLFIPAHHAPHKRGTPPTSPWHRHAMLALATQGEPAFRVSTVELDAPGRPYTVETVARLRAESGGRRLFFLMGADS
jgi:cytidyltransferase-like protein